MRPDNRKPNEPMNKRPMPVLRQKREIDSMKIRHTLLAGVVSLVLGCGAAMATERYFTYTYEPEVFPQGAAEFEQWVTLAAGRNRQVGQENYNRWELREE